MLLITVLASIVTVMMGLIVLIAWRRWGSLDSGARWIAGGAAVFFVWSLIAIATVVLGRRTRLFQEIPILLGTCCYLKGFADWQPRRGQRRLILAALVAFVGLWIVAQGVQGVTDRFSTISGPIHATMMTAAAGYTLITRVQATGERWTTQPWFWISTGFMLVYGTEAVLDPLWENIFGLRNDLVLAAGVVHHIGSIVGYALMIRGLVEASPGEIVAPAG